MNNLKIVVTLLVLIAIVCLGLTVAFKTEPPVKTTDRQDELSEVENVDQVYYPSNGGEK